LLTLRRRSWNFCVYIRLPKSIQAALQFNRVILLKDVAVAIALSTAQAK
jgi:hypothetical protein